MIDHNLERNCQLFQLFDDDVINAENVVLRVVGSKERMEVNTIY